jgi:hypothetical protein
MSKNRLSAVPPSYSFLVMGLVIYRDPQGRRWVKTGRSYFDHLRLVDPHSNLITYVHRRQLASWEAAEKPSGRPVADCPSSAKGDDRITVVI